MIELCDNFIIDLREIDVVQGNNLVLQHVTLQVEPGEWLYLIGKVGSGKTSLIRTIHGELPLTRGFAKVADFDLIGIGSKHLSQMRRRMGVVFQDFQLLHDRSIYENLSFVLRSTGWNDRTMIDERIITVLEKVGLSGKTKDMPHQLSGGEQQRVAIARALLNNPDLVIADEPTGNLDGETTADIMKIFMEINNHHQGPAVIMATHNSTILKNYPARTLRCDKGRLIPLDSNEEIDFSDL